MASESKSFLAASSLGSSVAPVGKSLSRKRLVAQMSIVYGLILASIWTPEGVLKVLLMMGAAITLLVFAGDGSYSWREMGLGWPSSRAWGITLIVGLALALSVPLISRLLGLNGAPFRILSFQQSWRYALWSLEQEFILQSFLFLRVESLTRSRWAVIGAASLFAVAHVPSPILTVLSLIGGLIFCDLFRRFRNIYPLGAVHALLGLNIASSFSERWLRHMRVGIGYLTFHLR